MPEDTSDDSSITDCCRSKQVAIRNIILLRTDNQLNRSFFVKILVESAEHVSRFVKLLRDKTAVTADAVARLLSDKETGIRDKILLFFTPFWKASTRKTIKVLIVMLPDSKKSEQIWSANKRVWQSDFKVDRGIGLKRRRAVFEIDPALARLVCLLQPCRRFLQQKF